MITFDELVQLFAIRRRFVLGELEFPGVEDQLEELSIFQHGDVLKAEIDAWDSHFQRLMGDHESGVSASPVRLSLSYHYQVFFTLSLILF